MHALEQQFAAVRKRQGDDDSDWGNTSDRNELSCLSTVKFLLENDIQHSCFSEGIVRVTTARGESLKLSLRTRMGRLTGQQMVQMR